MPKNITNEQMINHLVNNPKSGFYHAYNKKDLANINAIYDDLLSNYNPKRNQFVVSLYKTIGWTSVDNTIFNNPLGFLKQAAMRYGEYDEEIYVNMLESHDYNLHDTERELFRIYESYVMACFHELRFKKKWAVSISYDNLRNAFSNPFGLQSLINSKLAVVPSSVEYWEFKTVLALLDEGYKKGFFYPVNVPYPTDNATATNLLKFIKAYTRLLSFPNPDFNFGGSDAVASAANLVLIVTPFVEASLDVDALAVLWHLDKAEVQARIVCVDKFENENVIAFLADRRFFRWRDQLHDMGSVNNVDTLVTNFFYHAWEMISASPFYPVIAFTQDKAGVTEITAEEGQTFTAGSDTVIKFNISGTSPYTPRMFDMKIISDVTDPETTIVYGTDVLFAGCHEEAETITVEISSRFNKSVKTTVTLTNTKTADNSTD